MGGRRKRVYPSRLLETIIPLPPVEEQRRIVDLIASVDNLRATTSFSISSYQTLARQLRREHFGGLEGLSLPAASFFEVTMGRQRSPKHASGEHMVPYLRAANVKDGLLDLSDVKTMNFTPAEQARFGLISGDTLVTEGCGSIAQLGASAHWSSEIQSPVCFQNTLLRIRARPGVSIAGYAYQWARYSFESGAFANVASGTNIFHIGAERAGAMPVIAISTELQEDFLRIVEMADAAATASQHLLTRLTEARDAVLTDLLSGETVILDSYDELLERIG
jgi:type I restriction enzyme, S subunit